MEKINRTYEEIGNGQESATFLLRLLEYLHICYQIERRDIAQIPASGPVIVVANHPFGGIEGIILAAIIKSIRPDVKFMANYLLHRIPELRDMFIFVDPFDRRDSVQHNLKPLRQALAWVRRGGLLGIFPAGAVSHLHWRQRAITDPAWSPMGARLVRKTGATVVPVFFHGANGPFFQILGLVHPRLRTALLPHELINKRDKTIHLTVGNPIPWQKLQEFETDAAMTAYLRLRTYILKARHDQGRGARGKLGRRGRAAAVKAPVAPSLSGHRLIHEVAALSPENILIKSGDYLVCLARARQIPAVLREIGRLRELTFRQAHEGTGQPLDLDIFDRHYLHLFIWNRAKDEVVGAYRLGPTDHILQRLGEKGLYTSTLFHYQTALLEKISPALELGRSFVRMEYQKNYSALLLLWKGIGSFVARHPRYKILFGPVSINNQYHTISQQLIVNALKVNNFMPELSKLVKARKPFQTKIFPGLDDSIADAALADINEVSDLIADIEPHQQGIPILLKQYLKLGGKLLAFHNDQNFSNVLDGLILVDLTQTPLKLLERYMGKESAEIFITHHRGQYCRDDGQGCSAARRIG